MKTGVLYCGSSADLKQRVKDHNVGKGGAFTKKHKPFKLIYYEAFISKMDAEKQELFYKSGYGREVLREKIQESLNEIEKNDQS